MTEQDALKPKFNEAVLRDKMIDMLAARIFDEFLIVIAKTVAKHYPLLKDFPEIDKIKINTEVCSIAGAIFVLYPEVEERMNALATKEYSTTPRVVKFLDTTVEASKSSFIDHATERVLCKMG